LESLTNHPLSLNSRVGLKGFRIWRYEAIQRLANLVMLAVGFLSWMLLRSKRLKRRLFRFASRLDGLLECARPCWLRSEKTPAEPFKNS
jgi:hypothetical protein